jgi:hypothetical protein
MVRSAFASVENLLTLDGLRKCIRPLASQPFLATRPCWRVGKDRVERIWRREGLKVPQK